MISFVFLETKLKIVGIWFSLGKKTVDFTLLNLFKIFQGKANLLKTFGFDTEKKLQSFV